MSQPARERLPERLVVGLVRGVHGLRGAVRVEVLTDDPARFAPGSVLYAEGTDQPLVVEWMGTNAPGILVRFRELGTRDAAERLRDRYLEAERTRELRTGEFFWHEIEGARVHTVEGEELGHVAEVFRAGGGEVYAVRGGSRGEVLVPAVASVVVRLDPKGEGIVVDGVALGLDDDG